jgi:hypothetical protein
VQQTLTVAVLVTLSTGRDCRELQEHTALDYIVYLKRKQTAGDCDAKLHVAIQTAGDCDVKLQVAIQTAGDCDA